jgi:transcriptional antiterminator
MDKVTLKQLADVLNYSISTVFKELNDKEEISFDIKIKIVDTPKKIRGSAAQKRIKFQGCHRCYYY